MAVDDDFFELKSLAAFGIMIGIFFLWKLYSPCCLRRLCGLRRRPSRSRSFADNHIQHPRAPIRSPLHPSLFRLLPTSTYSVAAAAGADEHSQAPPECAICLDEFEEGDTGRLLPNCDHFFHLHCIDNWLRTNKTCPLCRQVVRPRPPRLQKKKPPPPPENAEASAGEEGQSENVNLPPPIWCPRNPRQQVIESEQVVIEIPEEDHRRSQRQITSLRELARLSLS